MFLHLKRGPNFHLTARMMTNLQVVHSSWYSNPHNYCWCQSWTWCRLYWFCSQLWLEGRCLWSSPSKLYHLHQWLSHNHSMPRCWRQGIAESSLVPHRLVFCLSHCPACAGRGQDDLATWQNLWEGFIYSNRHPLAHHQCRNCLQNRLRAEFARLQPQKLSSRCKSRRPRTRRSSSCD